MLDTVAKTGIEGLPLIQVRAIGGRRFEILSGIRVWQAAGLSQIHRVPVVECEVSDEEASAMVEHDYGTDSRSQQDVDDPIGLAKKLVALQKAENISITEAGRRFGLERANASNHIRLLRLPDRVQRLVAEGKLSVGHAKVMVNLPAAYLSQALKLVAPVAGRPMQVRDFETWVKAHREGGEGQGSTAPADDWAGRYSQRLGYIFGANVVIEDRGAAGRIVMNYTSHEELDGILDQYKKLGFSVE